MRLDRFCAFVPHAPRQVAKSAASAFALRDAAASLWIHALRWAGSIRVIRGRSIRLLTRRVRHAPDCASALRGTAAKRRRRVAAGPCRPRILLRRTACAFGTGIVLAAFMRLAFASPTWSGAGRRGPGLRGAETLALPEPPRPLAPTRQSRDWTTLSARLAACGYDGCDTGWRENDKAAPVGKRPVPRFVSATLPSSGFSATRPRPFYAAGRDATSC